MVMDRNEVLVGLDGSRSAWAALVWAARYARFTFTDLRAVHVLPVTVHPSWAWAASVAAMAGPVAAEPDDALIDLAARRFQAVAPEADWVLEHVLGPPGPVLVAESRHAQLLIVGTREHTGLARLLTGSVSHYCLSHASCPVVAIPVIQEAASLPLDQPRSPTTAA